MFTARLAEQVRAEPPRQVLADVHPEAETSMATPRCTLIHELHAQPTEPLGHHNID